MSTTKIDTGGNAHPGATHNDGMSLLDHFAGLAMQAIVRSGSEKSTVGLEHVRDRLWQHPRRIASTAYLIAAAMIAEKRRLEGL